MAEYRFKCPQCGRALESSREKGAAIECFFCKAPIKVPADAVEVIPPALVEVMDSGNRWQPPEDPPSRGKKTPPRVVFKQKGCLLQSLNCGCSCLVIILLVVGLLYGLFRLLFG